MTRASVYAVTVVMKRISERHGNDGKQKEERTRDRARKVPAARAGHNKSRPDRHRIGVERAQILLLPYIELIQRAI